MTRTHFPVAAAVVILAFPVVAADRSADRASDRSPAAQTALTDIEKTVGFVPGFLKAMPDVALPGTWEEMKGLQMNPNTAIPVKYKELIGLAVAAQIPCKYCVIGHTEFAKANGATTDQIGVAVAESGLTRHWSTWLNGTQVDESKFRADLSAMTDQSKKQPAAKNAPPTPAVPATLTDSNSAFAEMEQTFGMVPDFMKKFPTAGVVGAWKAMRDVEMNPQGVIPAKYVSLIGLAVSSQVPCKYCIIADTEFARQAGASDAEINEAVAMASFTRDMSTLLNGLQIDETAFKADVARLTRPQVKGKRVAAP